MFDWWCFGQYGQFPGSPGNHKLLAMLVSGMNLRIYWDKYAVWENCRNGRESKFLLFLILVFCLPPGQAVRSALCQQEFDQSTTSGSIN